MSKSCPCVLPFPSVHPSALQSRIYCTSSGSTVCRGQRVRCELFKVADCASWNLQCHRQRTWWQRGFISRVRLWGLIWFSDSFVNCNPPSCVCRLMIIHRAAVFLLRTSAAVKNCCPSSQNICWECVFTFWNVWNASYIDFVCQRSCETELSESNALRYSLAADCSCTTADCYVSDSFRLQFSDPLPSARCVEWVIAHTVIPEITHILTHVSTFHTVSGTRKFHGHLDLSSHSRSEPEGSFVSNCTEVHYFSIWEFLI